MKHRTFSHLALVFAFGALAHCGQFVIPEDARADREFEAGSADASSFADAQHDGTAGDATTNTDGATPPDSEAPDSGSGITGDLPPADVPIWGAQCNSLPFGAMVRVEDAAGPYPYPLRGGGVVPDGVYRLRRVTRYLEGRPLDPSRFQYIGEIRVVRGSEWIASSRFSLTEPFDLRVGTYRRFTVSVRYEPPFRFRTTTSCPSDATLILGDTYEIDGSVLRIDAGDMIMEYARD